VLYLYIYIYIENKVQNKEANLKRIIKNIRMLFQVYLPFKRVEANGSSAIPCTIQYRTVQYSTVQCSRVQYSAVECSTVQCSTVQYSRVQYMLLAVLDGWANAKLVLLLKANKHSDVVSRALVCYLFLFYIAVRQKNNTHNNTYEQMTDICVIS